MVAIVWFCWLVCCSLMLHSRGESMPGIEPGSQDPKSARYFYATGSGLDCGSDDPGSIPSIPPPRVGPLMAKN